MLVLQPPDPLLAGASWPQQLLPPLLMLHTRHLPSAQPSQIPLRPEPPQRPQAPPQPKLPHTPRLPSEQPPRHQQPPGPPQHPQAPPTPLLPEPSLRSPLQPRPRPAQPSPPLVAQPPGPLAAGGFPTPLSKPPSPLPHTPRSPSEQPPRHQQPPGPPQHPQAPPTPPSPPPPHTARSPSLQPPQRLLLPGLPYSILRRQCCCCCLSRHRCCSRCRRHIPRSGSHRLLRSHLIGCCCGAACCHEPDDTGQLLCGLRYRLDADYAAGSENRLSAARTAAYCAIRACMAAAGVAITSMVRCCRRMSTAPTLGAPLPEKKKKKKRRAVPLSSGEASVRLSTAGFSVGPHLVAG